MKNSLLYILFEAIAKGGPHIFLLFVVSSFSDDLYNTILLFISAEGLIALTYFSNYVEAIYALKEKFDNRKLLNTVFSINLFSLGLISLGIIVFKSFIYEYYSYDNIWTFYLILLVSFFIITFRFIVVNYQLEENHSLALKLKFFPFMLSFGFSIIGFYVFPEDRLFGFYLGKFLGFVLYFLVVLKHLKFKFFEVDLEIFRAYFSRIQNLVFIHITGWVSGYGYLNIVKNYVTPSELTEMGYVINIFTLFLLLSNGLNQVYIPRLKKAFELSIKSSKKIAIQYHLIYLVLIVASIIGYWGIESLIDIDIVKKYSPYFIWACVIFIVSTFNYISTPFYYIVDRYKRYMNINIIGSLIGFVVLLVSLMVLDIKDIIPIYIGFILVKCVLPYVDLIVNWKKIIHVGTN